MQDIDDSDPLDDILLSDEEPPDPKTSMRNKSFIFHKPKETPTTGDLSKEVKKKRMLAELFGSKDESKEEPEKSEEIIVPQTKSDWLDLKSETKPSIPESVSNKTVTWQTPAEQPFTIMDDTIKKSDFSDELIAAKSDDIFTISQPPVSRISETPDRRGSKSSAQKDNKKSKQRFKSLDFDLDLDFDKPTGDKTFEHENILKERNLNTNKVPEFKESMIKSSGEDVKRNSNQETIEKSNIELFYVPSTGNRRSGTPKGRSQVLGTTSAPSFITPDHSQNVVDSGTLKDSFPSWLDLKITDESSSTSVFRSENVENEEFGKKSKNDFLLEPKNIPTGDTSETKVLSTVLELRKKQEELQNIASVQTSNLIRHEQEIQNSAVELMLQHRTNINALMQIISPKTVINEMNEKLDDNNDLQSKIQNFESTVSQLRMKLIQQELEKSELQLKLDYAERKYSTNLVMLEDLYEYKLRVAKEKENYLKMEIQNLDEEYNAKLQRKKESEEEIVSSYKEKIRIMQEEHLNEVKYVSNHRGIKLCKESKTESMTDISNKKTISKELTVREIALENKQKELLELEEELNKQKLALEDKSVLLNTRMEEFEARNLKEKIAVEQQKKDLKLSQMIFEEKETSWKREKHLEKEYLHSCKEELENMKENLLKEERKLMKEKFELSTEKARIEVILNLDGTPGQLDNILLNKAELLGTLEEVNRLREKLQFEREEIKKEERRLTEEGWKLKEIEQQMVLQNNNNQKLLNESEMKREEGIQALKKAQRIESQMNDRIEEIETRLSNLRKKEDQLTKEKIEVSKERDIVNKKRYQLDMILPELTYEEQLPFNIMNRGIIDPKIMIMKWKTENDMDSLFEP